MKLINLISKNSNCVTDNHIFHKINNHLFFLAKNILILFLNISIKIFFIKIIFLFLYGKMFYLKYKILNFI